MERITISLERALLEAFDRLIAQRGYQNRSEAMRDLLRAHLEEAALSEEAAGLCVASLSYVYDHHRRDLAERLTALQHAHHELIVATMHVHLDHDHCLEAVILRGAATAVRRFADALIAERGVRHGKLNLVAVDVETSAHRHGTPDAPPASASSTPHVHLKPKN